MRSPTCVYGVRIWGEWETPNIVETYVSHLLSGNKGNLTETAFPMIVFLLLTLPMIMAYVFNMIFQTYV